MSHRAELHRLLGAREHQIQALEQRLTSNDDSRAAAREWARLQSHQRELAEWLADQATNEDGDVVQPTIDAGLGGESFIPGSFTASFQGRRYQFDLVSTKYSVCELDLAE